jgi:hypothetical protein
MKPIGVTALQSKKIGCPGAVGLLAYNTVSQNYTQLKSVVVEKNCNGVTVLNAGTTVVMWNGVPIAPGASMTVGGNQGEVYIGRVDINFFTQTPPPTTIINSAWVIQKFYEDGNFIQ